MREYVAAQSIEEAFTRAESPRMSKKLLIGGEYPLTYGTLVDRARRLNSLFQEMRLVPGDRVILSSVNDSALVTIFIALLRKGLTAVVIDPAIKAASFQTLLDISQPQALFIDRELVDRWETGDLRIIPINPPQQQNLFEKLLGRKTSLVSANDTFPKVLDSYGPKDFTNDVDFESEAYVLFTSGTTSTSKGVCLSHRNLFSHIRTMSRVFGYSGDTKLFNILSLHHTDGLIHGPIISFTNGGMVFRPFPFRVQRIGQMLDAMYRERITHFITVPTMLSMISSLGKEYRDSFRTEEFRFIISSSSTLDSNLWTTIETTFGTKVVNVYGLTETVVGGLFCGPDESSRKLGTVGKAIDCQVRIIDESGHDCVPGKKGELLMKGDLVTRGYLNAPEETAVAFSEGWFRTGDIFSCDEEGFYSIVGRKKNIIISGGINIHPQEIIDVLNRHPQVADAAVCGLEDETWGEIIVACVVPISPGAINEESLTGFCREFLESGKVPTRFYLFDVLPKTSSGKVKLLELKELVKTSYSGNLSSSENLTEIVLDTAASVFSVKQTALLLHHGPDDVSSWDSLSHLEFIAALEEKCRIEFSPVEIMSIASLAEAVRLVQEKKDGS